MFILEFIGKFFVGLLRGWLGDKRAEKAQRDVGAAQAVERGQEKVDAIANKQAAARADRPSDDERIARLRRDSRGG